jgi:ABC-type bacteriocin/lantibiotic exporter with double-glycine peptidase domain
LIKQEELENHDLGFCEALDLKGVHFSYSRETGKVLNNLSLKIKKGTRMGLIGRSGSGKTTLLEMIMGFLKQDAGEILLDGIPSNLTTSEWRKKIGYVPQITFLLDSTLLQNIVLNREVSLDRVMRVIEMVDLSEFLKTLPGGLHERVGEKGAKLSGGQRQRLGMARALYSDPEIIILDEATSALDPETEAKILENLAHFLSDKTMIFVGHRLQALKACNEVVLLNAGCVQVHAQKMEEALSISEIKDFFENESS